MIPKINSDDLAPVAQWLVDNSTLSLTGALLPLLVVFKPLSSFAGNILRRNPAHYIQELQLRIWYKSNSQTIQEHIGDPAIAKLEKKISRDEKFQQHGKIFKSVYRLLVSAFILFAFLVIIGLLIIGVVLISDLLGWNGTGDTHTDEALLKVVLLLSYPLSLAIGVFIVGVYYLRLLLV